MSEEVLKEKEGGALLRVKVKPDSQSFEIGDVNPWRKHLEVRVGSKPKGGEANRELLDELGSILEAEVSIVSGRRSEEKRLFVEGVAPERVAQELNLGSDSNEG